jgi:hypothetical protein
LLWAEHHGRMASYHYGAARYHLGERRRYETMVVEALDSEERANIRDRFSIEVNGSNGRVDIDAELKPPTEAA